MEAIKTKVPPSKVKEMTRIHREPNLSITGPITSAKPPATIVPIVTDPVNALLLHPNSSVIGFRNTLITGNVSALWVKPATAITATIIHP